MDLLQLAENHRRLQARYAEALVRQVTAAYQRSVAPGYGDQRVIDRWIADMLPLIRVMRERSASSAALYLRRSSELADAPTPRVADPDPVEDDALTTSLRVTGVAALFDKLGRGIPLDQALEEAAKGAAGAADRHALNGGRSVVANTVARDAGIIGYYRVTRDGCCSFCAVLASRGPVYSADSFDQSDPRFVGDGDVKVHDHCHCTDAPIYSRDQNLPDRNQEFADLWRSSTDGYSGNDALNAFRRAYEATLRD